MTTPTSPPPPSPQPDYAAEVAARLVHIDHDSYQHWRLIVAKGVREGLAKAAEVARAEGEGLGIYESGPTCQRIADAISRLAAAPAKPSVKMQDLLTAAMAEIPPERTEEDRARMLLKVLEKRVVDSAMQLRECRNTQMAAYKGLLRPLSNKRCDEIYHATRKAQKEHDAAVDALLAAREGK